MPNLPAARSELDRIEAFLRTRYHYPHPIFEHVATCRGLLEGELPTGAVEAPQETAAEPAAEKPVAEEPAAKETSEEPSPQKVAAPKPARRRTRRKSK